MANRLERLLAARNGGNQSEMARFVGVTPQAVQKWIAGVTEPRGKNLTLAAEFLGVSPSDLKFGTHSEPSQPIARAQVREADFDENVSPSLVGVRPIPVISAVQAGSLTDMESPYPVQSGFAIEYTDQELSRWAFALEIEGLSMMPDFRPGDRVIIDPDLPPQPGDFVVARNGSNQATFKKYRPRGMDSSGNMVFELVPLNDDYPTLRSDVEHLIVIGVMTEHRKRFRRTKP